MNRRLGSILCAIAGAATLSSCGSFDADRVASVNGKDFSTSEFEDYAKAQGGEVPVSGEQTRRSLSDFIQSKITLSDADVAQARSAYEQGFSGAPLICLAAIALARPEDATAVKDALRAGTPITDIVTTYASPDQAAVAPDGAVTSPDGAECYAPDQLNNPDLVAAITAVSFGEGADFAVTGGSLVVALRRWDTLPDDARRQIATAAGVTSSAKVSVDSRYGHWDAATGSVVADS